MRSMSSASTEYVECTVAVFNPATGVPIDPSADPVEMAFVAVDTKPMTADWKTAAWTAVRRAGILVGPAGSVTLPVGDYDAWIRITDNPEKPAMRFDTLRIT